MRFRAIAVLLPAFLLLVSCGGGESTRTVTIGDTFTMEIPDSLTEGESLAMDSLAGGFANDSMVLNYDYGQFAGAPGFEDRDSFKVTLMQIGGHPATIEYYEDAGSFRPYVAAAHIERGSSGLTMVVHATSEEEQERAVAILRSVEFLEDGDPAAAPGGEIDAGEGGDTVAPSMDS